MNLSEALLGMSRAGVFEVAHDEAVSLVRKVLLHPERAFPVVGVTTSPIYGRCLVDVERIARDLRDVALVVVVPTGRSTFAIASELCDDLAAYGGFVRVWMPGLHAASSGREHPLFRLESERDGVHALRSIVLAARHAPRHTMKPHHGVSSRQLASARPACCRQPGDASSNHEREFVAGPQQIAFPRIHDDRDLGSLGWWHSDC